MSFISIQKLPILFHLPVNICFYPHFNPLLFVDPRATDSFLNYPPPSEMLPVLGPMERWWRLHLMRPCCVALGLVLIWVVSPDWLRSFITHLCESMDHMNIEHAHSEYSLPKRDSIHRPRVKSVIRPPLYP